MCRRLVWSQVRGGLVGIYMNGKPIVRRIGFMGLMTEYRWGERW